MGKTISISKDTFKDIPEKLQKTVDDVTNYFQNAPTDELIAWISIGVGFFFILLAIIIM